MAINTDVKIQQIDATVDIIIVGGGLTGCIAAAAFSRLGLRVTLIDNGRRANDDRTTAISAAASEFLASVGIWQDVPFAPIKDICITDYNAPMACYFKASEVQQDAFGYIVSNSWLKKKALSLAGIKPINAAVKNVQYDAKTQNTTVTLDNGTIHTARAVIAADGRNSGVRQQVGITAKNHAYAQTAIVATIAHEQPHHGMAHERFLPGGPLALLPLNDDGDIYQSAMVWTERAAVADQLLSLPEEDFTNLLQARFGDWFGTVSLHSKRQGWPLSVVHADQYAKDNVFLLGDAAHAIHPIAGQGFNLSLRDLAFLYSAFKDALQVGLFPDLARVAGQYNLRRRPDNTSMVKATHLLNNLFMDDRLAVQKLRRAGLQIVDVLPPVKGFFMKHAMGHSRLAG